ncbi:MAG: hypothetical protein L6Q97_09575 [Thermoanaerobaculia bacterium]|nr:hypothetical protein [Thermoanaerobaculia bacterium]
MKTQVSFFIALLLAGIALITGSATRPADRMIIRITKGDAAKTIGVQITNLQQQRTRVAVVDLDGKCWFSEFVTQTDGYAKTLGLNAMPNGDYYCYVGNAKGQFIQSFRIDGESMSFAAHAACRNPGAAILLRTGNSSRPVIARIDNTGHETIQLRLANLQQQDYRIRLNVAGGDVVYEEKASGEYGFAQLFNMAGMAKGGYFMSVKSGAGLLIQHFNLNKPGIEWGELEWLEPLKDKREDLAQQ